MNHNMQSLLEKFQAIHKTQSINPEDVDYSILNYHIPFLERLDTIENSSVVLFDFLEHKYRFLTARFKYLIGYDRDSALSEGPEYFLKQIHPDDLPKVIETTIESMRFNLELPIGERKDYKLCFSFRIRHASGIYIRLVQQVVTLELDKKGNPWLALITNDLVPNEELNGPFRRFLINLKNSKYYLFTPDETTTEKAPDLSTREIEILGLMAKGLPSKQIADQLFISINTVNNHRANILRKMQAGNAVEAVQYAMRMGIV